MKKLIVVAAMMATFVVAAFGQGTPTAAPTATSAPTPVPYDKLKVGDMAPDFTLPDLTGKQVKLSEFRGKSNVVLAFYVFAFTGG